MRTLLLFPSVRYMSKTAVWKLPDTYIQAIQSTISFYCSDVSCCCWTDTNRSRMGDFPLNCQFKNARPTHFQSIPRTCFSRVQVFQEDENTFQNLVSMVKTRPSCFMLNWCRVQSHHFFFITTPTPRLGTHLLYASPILRDLKTRKNHGRFARSLLQSREQYFIVDKSEPTQRRGSMLTASTKRKSLTGQGRLHRVPIYCRHTSCLREFSFKTIGDTTWVPQYVRYVSTQLYILYGKHCDAL